MNPLHLATKHGHRDFLHVLLQHGCEIDAQYTDRSTAFAINREYNYTALHLACLNNDIGVLSLLLLHGANPLVRDQVRSIHNFFLILKVW